VKCGTMIFLAVSLRQRWEINLGSREYRFLPSSRLNRVLVAQDYEAVDLGAEFWWELEEVEERCGDA
jgi:hypothetical protein